MNGFLVDTNVISELLRPAPDAHVAEWSQGPAKQTLFLERGGDGRASQRRYHFAGQRQAHPVGEID
jgi:hypothetical protein